MTAAASLSTGVGKSSGCVAYDLRGYTYLSGAIRGGRPKSTTDDVIGIAWDGLAGEIWFAKNNVWMLSGNPVTGANPVYTNAALTNTLFPAVSFSFYGLHVTLGVSSLIAQFNLADFSYAPPDGFEPYGLLPVTISGNTIVSGGGAGDHVAIIDAYTKELAALVVPDPNGDWSATIAEGDYYIIHFGAGCQPIAHGPYTIAAP